MRPALRVTVRRVLLGTLVCAEPVLHALGVPHPEGLAQLALNHLATTGEL